MKSDLETRAEGRWREILSVSGIPAKALNGKNGPCPMCGGKDRFRFLDARGQKANGAWICNQCGGGTGLHLLAVFHGISHKEAARMVATRLGEPMPTQKRPTCREPDPAQLREAMRRVWGASHHVLPDGIVASYLRGRGLRVDGIPSCLRETASLWHRSGRSYPGMLALVRAADGAAVNIHRTYLHPDGRKADVEPVRMMMQGTHPAGSAVRLMPHGDTLGIAEGIETAWAAWQLTGIPCWAALNAGRLAAWVPPPGVRRVHIFVDFDGAGCAASNDLDHKLRCEGGMDVTVWLPPDEGTDWNDVLRGTAS